MASEQKELANGEAIETITPVLTEDGAVRLDDVVLEKMANDVKNIGQVTQDAHESTEFEKHMSFGQAIRMYPKATMFSFILSLSLIMEGW